MCPDKQTDCLFTHEVAVMPSNGSDFKYLGNKITFMGDKELPSGEPRIPAQRTQGQWLSTKGGKPGNRYQASRFHFICIN